VSFAPLLRELTDADLPVIERLWQLYSHDMSEVRGTLPNEDGLYKAGRLPGYLADAGTQGYRISRDGAHAGFAFVTGLDGNLRHMGDFFVVRAVRRKGVGYRVVRELLDRYPGAWEIGFQGGNRGAPEFWRRIAADAVGDDWVEELRPVPDKPHIPHDHFILFSVG
jgi:predicted acetyltransferase